MRLAWALLFVLAYSSPFAMDIASSTQLIRALLQEAHQNRNPECLVVHGKPESKHAIDEFQRHYQIRRTDPDQQCIHWYFQTPQKFVQTLAFSNRKNDLQMGVLAALTARNTRPQIWLNPDAARRLNLHWPMGILRLVQLYPEKKP